MATFGTAERALATTEAPLRERALAEAARVLEIGDAAGARALVPGAPGYPAPLLELDDPPPVLWAIGADETLTAPVVAIVGTRAASAYGERVARELSGALARAGACIASGMARGIDAAAHRAALGASGRTVAVLGTGVDIAYPSAHRALHAEIARRGLLLSERAPGDRAGPGSFPSRNRIIAALADVVLVVEAGRKSGALITASAALELGRTVAAVPGAIDDPRSEGSNELLRDGAVVVVSAADIVALVGLTPPPRGPGAEAGPDEKAVWEALRLGAADIDSLAARSRLPARRCMAAVTALEIAGAVECALTGEIRRR